MADNLKIKLGSYFEASANGRLAILALVAIIVLITTVRALGWW
jgi:hypothetical protein